MGMIGMPAGDIGVQAFNLVRQSHFLKKIECSIDGRWLGCAFAIEIGEQIIGFCWLLTLKQEVQDLSPDRRQFLTARLHEVLCFREKSFSVAGTAGRIGVIVSMRVGHGRHFG